MEQPPARQFTVRAVYCNYRSSDEEVYQALKRATAPLERTWEKWMKYVDGQEAEGEHFEVYEKTLSDLQEAWK